MDRFSWAKQCDACAVTSWSAEPNKVKLIDSIDSIPTVFIPGFLHRVTIRRKTEGSAWSLCDTNEILNSCVKSRKKKKIPVFGNR